MMSKELRNLLQRKEKAAEKARIALSAAKAESRTDLTNSEQSSYDAAMADIESLNREIQVEQANIEAMMNAPSFPNGPVSGGLDFSYTAPRRVDPAKRRSFAGLFSDT